MQHYDVIIVGAGLSGIGAAYHLQSKCPNKTYTILEGRDTMGGTWDLFKYPGIRSDSDMYTLGFSFNPWNNPKAIADGPSILQYIKDTAAKFGIDKHIQYKHKVLDASWSDTEALWTIEVSNKASISCNFLIMCSGYYDYTNGYTPDFKDINKYKGKLIHPQLWDTSLDYSNKEVVIIGSGATAVTLLPEIAKIAKKATMLQRSPTYMINMPSEDRLANFLYNSKLPTKTAYEAIRWKNILLSMAFYNASRQFPDGVKKLLKGGVRKQLGNEYDMSNFDPKYNPWDQRLCMVPDNDLFNAINSGTAQVVTDTIARFTAKGIQLDSGKHLVADIVITATGLKMQLMGGMTVHINGKAVQPGDFHCYRGVMFSGLPNFGMTVGYTNASWTLKCDLNCHYMTRIINHMDKYGYKVCTPNFDHTKFDSEPLIDLNSGYVQRAQQYLPKQGSAYPWKVYQNYIIDTFSIRYSPTSDKYLVYK